MKSICKHCNNEYEWNGIKRYPKGQGIGFNFSIYCSKECSKNDKEQNKRKTNLERYGSESFVNIEKRKQTKLERYGSSGYNNQEKRKETIGNEGFKEIIKKGQQTKLEKYGDPNYRDIEKMKQTFNTKYNGVGFASKEIKEKTHKTRKEKYNNSNYTNREKAKSTQIKKYNGVGLASNIIQEKFKATNLLVNGAEWYSNREQSVKTQNERYGGNGFALEENQIKRQQILLEKYGTLGLAAIPEIHAKIVQTHLDNHGVEYPYQTNKWKEKFNNKDWVKNLVNKSHETKKKNGSYGKSKIEDQIFEKLKSKWSNTIRQHSNATKYPFACDFYIPEIDTWIEYQGWWMHGKEPFNENDEMHIKRLENWKSKSSPQYINAITIWTEKDTAKRQVAKENKLLWLEFFNLNEFETWFETHTCK